MFETTYISAPINPISVPYGDFNDLKVQFDGTEDKIKVSKIFSISLYLKIILTEKHLRAA